MAAFRSSRRHGGRWWLGGVTFLAVVFFAVLFVAGSGATLAGSTFDTSNGDLTSTTLHDWNPPGVPPGNIGPIQPINCATSLRCGLDEVKSATDNAFGQGAKEDDPAPTVVTGQIPPNKDDLSRFYVNQEKAGSTDFLYLAWERANLLGSAHLDFEFNQSTTPSANGVTPVRTAGDVLITFDFGGSGTPDLGLLHWVTSGATSQCEASNSLPCWGNRVDLSAAGFAEGSVNTTDVTDNNPPGNPTVLAGDASGSTFGEAAINLSLSGLFPPGQCTSLGSVYLKSRSSGSSFVSELKDFIAPIGVHVSNCGEIKIIKHTDPRGNDQNFGFSTNVPSAGAGAATFSKAPDTTGATTTFTLNDKGNSNADSADNTEDITNVQPGSYTVTEGAEPNGYLLESLSCSSGGSRNDTTAEADITVSAGSVVTCTYTNQVQLTTTATDVHNAAHAVITSAAIGSTVHDSAKVTGTAAGGTPTGNVSFTLYQGTSCSGEGSAAGTVDLNASGVADPSTTATVPVGGLSYKATYNGSTIYNGSTGPCEPLEVILHPAIAIEKSPDDKVVRDGDKVTFTIKVTNTGDVDLSNVTVSDPLTPSCDKVIGTLLQGASTSYTCTTGALSASFTNIASVTGHPPVGPDVTASDNAPVTVTTPPAPPVVVTHPAISITKSPPTQTVTTGLTVTFTIVVTNTGDVTLTNVTVTDALSPGCARTKTDIPALASMAPGATVTYQCTSAAVTASFTNVAIATGTPPSGPNVTASASAAVVATAPAKPPATKKPKPKVVSHKKPKATG